MRNLRYAILIFMTLAITMWACFAWDDTVRLEARPEPVTVELAYWVKLHLDGTAAVRFCRDETTARTQEAVYAEETGIAFAEPTATTDTLTTWEVIDDE